MEIFLQCRYFQLVEFRMHKYIRNAIIVIREGVVSKIISFLQKHFSVLYNYYIPENICYNEMMSY